MIHLKSSKGFTLVEALLIILILSFLGFAGWYVYNENKNKVSTSDTSKAEEKYPYEGWQTHTGDPEKYEPLPAKEGDGVKYSFKYPAGWKFYPRDTEIVKEGSKFNTSYQQIVAPGKTSSDLGIAFYSIETNLSAEDHFKSLVGDQNELVGPVWGSVKRFTTKNGYTAHTARLEDRYETSISNGKGVVSFAYSSRDKEVMDIVDKVFESVIIY